MLNLNLNITWMLQLRCVGAQKTMNFFFILQSREMIVNHKLTQLDSGILLYAVRESEIHLSVNHYKQCLKHEKISLDQWRGVIRANGSAVSLTMK